MSGTREDGWWLSPAQKKKIRREMITECLQDIALIAIISGLLLIAGFLFLILAARVLA